MINTQDRCPRTCFFFNLTFPEKLKYKTPMNNKPLSPREAAQILGVSQKTVARYRLQGRIRYIQYSSRLFKYRYEDILAFQESCYKERQLSLF